MADYAIVNNLTDYAVEMIQTDPNLSSNLASQVNSDVQNSTNGNYGISYVTVDLVGKKIWYDIEPLTVSAKAEIQQASLGRPSIGWLDTVKKIIAVIVAVIAFVIGALVGGWALLAGALIAGGILLWSYLTDRIEYKQDMVETDDEYARQLRDGEITQSQYNEFTEAKHKVMESDGIPWTAIIIGGMVGLLALGALMIITRKQ